MPSKHSTKPFLASGTFSPFSPIVPPISEAIFHAQVKPNSLRKDNVIHPRHKSRLLENSRTGSSAKLLGAQPVLPHGRRAHCHSIPHPGHSPGMSDRSCHVDNQRHGVSGNGKGDGKKHQRWANARQMAWPHCRWLRNYSSKLAKWAYTPLKGPWEGQWSQVPKGTSLAKNNHSQGTKGFVPRPVKNQTLVVWAPWDDGRGNMGQKWNKEEYRHKFRVGARSHPGEV